MKVYISGPVSNGGRFPPETQRNCAYRAMSYADLLFAKGHSPLCPHLTVFMQDIYPQSYESWMRSDLEWLVSADAVLRIPGESSGADREVEHATIHGIPVYYSLDDIPDSEVVAS